jgi:hypothetical protein
LLLIPMDDCGCNESKSLFITDGEHPQKSHA